MAITLTDDDLSKIKNRALLKLIASKTRGEIAAAVDAVKNDRIALQSATVVALIKAIEYDASVHASIQPSRSTKKKSTTKGDRQTSAS